MPCARNLAVKDPSATNQALIDGSAVRSTCAPVRCRNWLTAGTVWERAKEQRGAEVEKVGSSGQHKPSRLTGLWRSARHTCTAAPRVFVFKLPPTAITHQRGGWAHDARWVSGNQVVVAGGRAEVAAVGGVGRVRIHVVAVIPQHQIIRPGIRTGHRSYHHERSEAQMWGMSGKRFRPVILICGCGKATPRYHHLRRSPQGVLPSPCHARLSHTASKSSVTSQAPQST